MRDRHQPPDVNPAITCLVAALLWLGGLGVSIAFIATLVYVVIWVARKALGL